MYKRMLRSVLAAAFVAALGFGVAAGSVSGPGEISWSEQAASVPGEISWSVEAAAGDEISWGAPAVAGDEISWSMPTGEVRA